MQPTLHEKFIAVIRRKRYALRTERTSWAWVLSFLRFCRHAAGGAWRHPRDLGAADIEAFLSHLAVERRVAAATQNQAVNSIVFLYKQVLEPDPGTFNAVRARPSQRVPTMLSRREVHAVLTNLAAPLRMIAELLYGGGLRMGEACAVRIMDLDLDRLQLTVRRGKGDKDRITPLP